METQQIEVYVLSYAPSYDRCAVGGFDWYWVAEDLIKGLSGWLTDQPSEFTSRDYRICTLRFPATATKEQIAEFLDSAEALNVVDPPDPSGEVSDAFDAWRAKRQSASIRWTVTVKRTITGYHEEVVRAPADWDARRVAKEAAEAFWRRGDLFTDNAFVECGETEDTEWAEPHVVTGDRLVDNGVTL